LGLAVGAADECHQQLGARSRDCLLEQRPHARIIPRPAVMAESTRVVKAPSATVDPMAASTGICESPSTPKLATVVMLASASEASVRGAASAPPWASLSKNRE